MSKGGATRRAARLAAVQALYQMEVAGKGVLETLGEFETHWIGREVDGVDAGAADRGFFRDLVGGVLREQAVIDKVLDETLAENWRLARLEAVTRAILRAGAYELAFRRDVPVASSIAAYLDVAEGFHEQAETKFVNGVLDAVARRLRADETKPRAQMR
jgi:transcription antitermination protein NusB